MARDSKPQDAPTRRQTLKYGAGLVGGVALAGCSSDSEPGSTPAGDEASSTESSTDTPTETATPTDAGYTASIAPVGEVEFDSVPEDVFTILTHHAGMTLALGHGDALNAMHAPGYYQSLWSKFTHQLDGVSVDWEGLYSSWPPTKEKLFELDSDVHLADPAKVATAEKWERDDIEQIAEHVAPWFGNTLSDTNQEPPASYADQYEYYTLWEIFGRVADVFQEQARYEALAEVHSSMLSTIEDGLPAEDERPSAALVLFSSSDDRMWGYKLNRPGYYAAHSRPLGATDALKEAVGEGYGKNGGNIEIDAELLLEADPDKLLVFGPMTDYHNIDDIRSELKDGDVTGDLTAVKNGDVYTQGARNQGPIINLFQLEMTAKQLYPEQFGEWPGYENGEAYPDVPAEEQLFDRDRVAEVITDGVDER